MAARASAQTLYESSFSSEASGAGSIIIVGQETFATGLTTPFGLAFNGAGDLFVGSETTGTITEITPGGTQIPITLNTPGLSIPNGLAFNSAGDLIVASHKNNGRTGGVIIEITPGGVESDFEMGSQLPQGLSVNSAGDVFMSFSSGATGGYEEFSPSGESLGTFSGLNSNDGLTMPGGVLPTPEPSTLALTGIGIAAFLGWRSRAISATRRQK